MSSKKRLASILGEMESTIAMIKRNLDHDYPVVAVPSAELAKLGVDAVVAAKNYENVRFTTWAMEGLDEAKKK